MVEELMYMAVMRLSVLLDITVPMQDMPRMNRPAKNAQMGKPHCILEVPNVMRIPNVII